LFYGGDVVEVVEFDGLGVTVRNERTGEFSAVPLGRLVAGARPMQTAEPGTAEGGPGVGVSLAGLSSRQRVALAERAGHVREVISGFRAGHPGGAVAGEPRAGFGPELLLRDRVAVKAAELGVSARTVDRWVAAYRDSGEAGLVDSRTVKGRGCRVDGRWDEAVRRVVAESVGASTPTRSALLRRAGQRLVEEFGVGVVAEPPRSTAYARLAELTRGTNAVSGSAKARRSIADRPRGVYGRLRAARPGEYVVLDTQDLDIYAMEPVTCRWVPVQLTVAQDLFSRCILGLRVTACSTKAVDVAGVLFEAVCPPGEDVAGAALAPCLGVPEEVVFTEEGPLPGGVCPPETLVVDHGRAFLSAHVISVCTQLGMSVQPAQPRKPTDKPTVERFFRTLREGLIQHLPAYKGPDVHSRGEGVEEQAFFYIHEVEEIVREWVAEVYHRRAHDGLVVAQWPGLPLSPVEMLRVGVARAGRLRMLPCPQLALEFLAVVPRRIQHYGVEVDGLRYNGAVLDGYRNASSPYGGALAGRWPIRVNPDDMRLVYFQDPADGSWHALAWEHAPTLDMPFSAEAAAYARRLAARQGRHVGASQALAQLLARWDRGMVTDRRERRMAVRLSAERGALALPAASGSHLAAVAAGPAPGDDSPAGDGDTEEEILDSPAGDDFYADAFDVIG
jgi:transposase InsO family protein